MAPEMEIIILFGVGENTVAPEMGIMTLFGVGESAVAPEMEIMTLFMGRGGTHLS